MAKYEVMLIADPREEFEKIESFINNILKQSKIKKLERTELAYEINKSKTAHYFLINTNASSNEIDDLTTKVNISKKIWRMLAINLDKEVGKEKSIELIAKRKVKLQKEYEERQKQRELRLRESGEKPYRKFEGRQNQQRYHQKEGNNE